jgi:hypothetical protein
MSLPTLSIPGPIDASHVLVATVRFEASLTAGTDWSSGNSLKLFITQNSVSTFSEAYSFAATRLPIVIHYSFPLVAKFAITLGITTTLGPGVTATIWNFKLQGELIKR